MKNCEVLFMIATPNKKILFYRKKYKITQKNLSYGCCHLTTLCSFEKNNTKISDKILKKITDRLNYILEDLGVKERIDFEWLIRPIENQIDDELNDRIVYLYKTGNDTLSDLINDYFEYFSIENKLKLYFNLGNFYYKKKKNYKKSKYYYERVLCDALLLKEYKLLSVAILNLLRINYYLACNDESVFLYKKYFNIFGKNQGEIKGIILYNFALAFQNEKKYKVAISLYEKCKAYTVKELLISHAQINIGICYQNLKEYKKSLSCFRDIVFKTYNPTIKLSCYANIISCARENEDLVLIKTSIPKLESLIEKEPLKNRFQDYYTLGKAYIFIGDLKNAVHCFETELDLGIMQGYYKFNPKTYIKTVNMLLSLYTIRDKEKLKLLKDKIIEIPEAMISKSFIINVLSSYNDMLMYEIVSELLYKFNNKFKEV